ncbi:MAG: hypothetical protein E6H64_13575, partial [Betaproteobacteria bacterium]
RVRVELVNAIGEATIVHWHGLAVDTRNDGAGTVLAAPGERYAYSFDVRNRGALYWYHPHPHGLTAGQAYRGMFGLLEIADADEEKLRAALALTPRQHLRQRQGVPVSRCLNAHLSFPSPERVQRPDLSSRLADGVGQDRTVHADRQRRWVASGAADLRRGVYRLRRAPRSPARPERSDRRRHAVPRHARVRSDAHGDGWQFGGRNRSCGDGSYRRCCRCACGTRGTWRRVPGRRRARDIATARPRKDRRDREDTHEAIVARADRFVARDRASPAPRFRQRPLADQRSRVRDGRDADRGRTRYR